MSCVSGHKGRLFKEECLPEVEPLAEVRPLYELKKREGRAFSFLSLGRGRNDYFIVKRITVLSPSYYWLKTVILTMIKDLFGYSLELDFVHTWPSSGDNRN